MKKLFRDPFNKKVAGICGGLGYYFQIDPTIIRLIALFLLIFTGGIPFLMIYLIAAMVIPVGPTTYIDYDSKKLYRSKSDRKIAGVCGGLAERFDLDPTIIRLVAVILGLVTGILPLLGIYFVSTLIIPKKYGR